MKKNVNIIKSINQFLYELVEVPEYAYVYERTQEALAIKKLDAGEVVIFYSKGEDLNDSINHPVFKLDILIVSKMTHDIIMRVNEVKDTIEGSTNPTVSFALNDYSSGSPVLDGQLVILKRHTVQSYWDKDSYMYLPMTFELGYGNTF